MSITLYTKPKSLLTLGLAVVLAVDPSLIFGFLGLPLGDGGMLLGRLLGLVYLGIGMSLWFIRDKQDLPTRDALVLFVVDLLATGAVVHAQLLGVMNPLGWALAAVFLCSGLGFAWCATRAPAKATYA